MMIEKIRDFLLVMAFLVVMCAVFVKMADIWVNHPAEQPISGVAYMEQLQGGETR